MRFVGGRALIAGVLEDTDVHVAAGLIAETGGGAEVNLDGLLLLPGIVDLHGDAYDRHIAARRGAVQDMSRGYWNVDAEFGANGITTAILAQFYSWEGGMRGPDFARRMMSGLSKARPDLVTDMQLQMRLEVSMVDDFEDALDMIDAFGIRYVVFNDHLPRAALRAGKRPPRLNGTALKSGRNPEKHLAYMYEMLENEPREEAALTALAAQLQERGVRLGSHDDATIETRAAYRDMGVAIAEFPETAEVAEEATAKGEPVIIGAPNVVRGASHNGNASGRDLAVRGLVDALVSDYHYPSLIAAVEVLDREGFVPFEQAWSLVSSGPAAVLGLTDRGHIKPGLRADLTILDPETYRVLGTMSAGRWSFLCAGLAARLGGRT
ncbi:MAG: alpha-D-ribose 1-methylphosphonate 5-triphosphate diphosphatase [Pseudomonadota bacterium]